MAQSITESSSTLRKVLLVGSISKIRVSGSSGSAPATDNVTSAFWRRRHSKEDRAATKNRRKSGEKKIINCTCTAKNLLSFYT